VLPLGTLNLLAGDFGMPSGLAESVAAIVTAERQRMDLGLVNGRWFHTVSGIGFFSQMALAREETRGTKLPFARYLGTAIATWRALRRMGRFELTVEVDGQVREVEAHSLLVTNNRFLGGPVWRRKRLDEGRLEVHIGHDASALQRILAGADVISGTWRNNPTIETFAATSFVVRSSRRPRLWVATDGETSREKLPLTYEIRPKALSVLVPPTAPERSEVAEHATVEPRPAA